MAACVGRVISSGTCQARAAGLTQRSERRFTVGMYTISRLIYPEITSGADRHIGRLQNKVQWRSEGRH